MKRSYIIALSGISSALATLFVVGATFLPTMKIALIVMSAIAISLPLTKNSWTGSLMSFIVSAIITFFVCNVKALPFILFFGPYAIIQYLLDYKFMSSQKIKSKGIKLAISIIIKVIWFTGAFFACYYLMKISLTDITLLGGDWLTLPILYIILLVIAVLYDILFRFVFKSLINLVNRIVK